MILRRVSFFVTRYNSHKYLSENETKIGNILTHWSVGPRPVLMMKKTGGRKSRWTVPLKGQCHKIFDLYFFPLIKPIWAPDKQSKMDFLKNLFSLRIQLRSG